ncbi:MAG: hypothetical protein WB987_11620 [Candidatus Acidiferrales bacterium]
MTQTNLNNSRKWASRDGTGAIVSVIERIASTGDEVSAARA